jgi:hypothetical protein
MTVNRSKGALTLAEGRYDYKVDVSIIMNNGRDKKDFVVRTCLDQYSVWKAKYAKGGSPFKAFIKGTMKEAAIVDREVWVFGVDAAKANDIFTSVKIGMDYFKVSADEILGDIYVKNLNAESENAMLRQALVDANKKLYTDVCLAIREAAKLLGCRNTLNFWAFSNNANPKILKADLHKALDDGGAEDIETDDESKHVFSVGDNFGGPGQRFKTNLHLAKLKV